jgi:predicted nucleic acid-binding protein
MVFVDTSAWFAAVVPTDSDHLHAARWLAANSERLLTTDYVVDETLTLLRARGNVGPPHAAERQNSKHQESQINKQLHGAENTD